MMVRVGFSRPKKMNPLSWAIMKVLKTNYSHTFLMFDVNTTGQQVVYHATHDGVNCLEFDKFLKTNMVMDMIVIDDLMRASEALRFCIAKLGSPYSYMTLFAVYFNIKFGDGDKALICSELAARALNVDVENIDLIDPKKLREYLNVGN
jgi:uncharacterized protein YycO